MISVCDDGSSKYCYDEKSLFLLITQARQGDWSKPRMRLLRRLRSSVRSVNAPSKSSRPRLVLQILTLSPHRFLTPISYQIAHGQPRRSCSENRCWYSCKALGHGRCHQDAQRTRYPGDLAVCVQHLARGSQKLLPKVKCLWGRWRRRWPNPKYARFYCKFDVQVQLFYCII